MKTIALRFGEHFSPECGTIAAHQQVIDELGYVWYGKMGNPVATHIIEDLISQEDTRILLINSGKADRYWAHVSKITKDIPDLEGIPAYYRNIADKFKTWFKVTAFEPAQHDIMSKCYVVSSGAVLGKVSKYSMSPYFIINCEEKGMET